MGLGRIKLTLFLFLFLFLLNFIYALDCQYTDNNRYEKDVNVFYEGGSKLGYNLLEIKDITQGFSGSPMSFKVYNNYNSEINVTVKYLFNGALNSFNHLIVAAGGYSPVTGPSSPGLDVDSIYFEIHTTNLEAKRETTTVDNYTCEECPSGSGIICLNDGVSCNSSIQCGGGNCVRGYCSRSKACYHNDCQCNSITELQCNDNTSCVTIKSKNLGEKPICRIEECATGYINTNTGACALKNGENCSTNDACASGNCNPARICGEFRGCLAGEQLCNSSCLTPSIKQIGEAYTCNWECVNGTIACDGFCRCVSCKKANEEYYCQEECKSGMGKNGVCKWNVKEWVYFWVISIIVVSLIVCYFVVYKRRKEEEKLRNLKKDKEKIDDDINKSNIRLKLLKEEEEKGNEKISSLKEKIKSADKEAKVILEEKLKIEEDNQKERIEQIKNTRKKVDEELENLGSKIKARDEMANNESENTKREIEAALDKYERIYGREKIYYDKETGYLKFKSNDKDLHRYIYKNKFNLLDNQHIHHIDKDKLNNEIWNLLAIDNNIHFGFNHGKVDFKDWKSGIEQLKKQLGYGTKNNPFPEHIQEKIREIEK